jgi:hypothetical protein
LRTKKNENQEIHFAAENAIFIFSGKNILYIQGHAVVELQKPFFSPNIM